MKTKLKILSQKRGRVHLMALAFIVVCAGLILDQWWWKIGALIVLIQFVEAYVQYRTLD